MLDFSICRISFLGRMVLGSKIALKLFGRDVRVRPSNRWSRGVIYYYLRVCELLRKHVWEVWNAGWVFRACCTRFWYLTDMYLVYVGKCPVIFFIHWDCSCGLKWIFCRYITALSCSTHSYVLWEIDVCHRPNGRKGSYGILHRLWEERKNVHASYL